MPELLAGENLVQRYRRHWILLVRHLVVPAIILLLVIGIDALTGGPFKGEAQLTLLLLGLAIMGLWAIVGWVRWNADSLTLTDKRVILEEGIFNRTTKVIALDRVTDVGTRQSLLGSVFHYGTVEIHTASMGGAETFTFVPLPDAVRDEVFVQSGHMGAEPAAAVLEAQALPPNRREVEQMLRNLINVRVTREFAVGWATPWITTDEALFESPEVREVILELANADQRSVEDFRVMLGRLEHAEEPQRSE